MLNSKSCFSLEARRAARLPFISELFLPSEDPIDPHFPPAAYLFFWHLDILIRMRLVLLGLLIFFAVLVYFAAQEIYAPLTQSLLPLVKESFKSPTRASDCRCLPGYIPSKEGTSSEYIDLGCFNDRGDRALKGAMGRPHTKESCGAAAKAAGAKYFGLQDGNECWIGGQGYDKYGKSGGDCPVGGGVWKQHTWKISAAEDSDTYFCQNLDDSQKTKACY